MALKPAAIAHEPLVCLVDALVPPQLLTTVQTVVPRPLLADRTDFSTHRPEQELWIPAVVRTLAAGPPLLDRPVVLDDPVSVKVADCAVIHDHEPAVPELTAIVHDDHLAVIISLDVRRCRNPRTAKAASVVVPALNTRELPATELGLH